MNLTPFVSTPATCMVDLVIALMRSSERTEYLPRRSGLKTKENDLTEEAITASGLALIEDNLSKWRLTYTLTLRTCRHADASDPSGIAETAIGA